MASGDVVVQADSMNVEPGSLRLGFPYGAPGDHDEVGMSLSRDNGSLYITLTGTASSSVTGSTNQYGFTFVVSAIPNYPTIPASLGGSPFDMGKTYDVTITEH
jgi:hypothetical protein